MPGDGGGNQAPALVFRVVPKEMERNCRGQHEYWEIFQKTSFENIILYVRQHLKFFENTMGISHVSPPKLFRWLKKTEMFLQEAFGNIKQ